MFRVVDAVNQSKAGLKAEATVEVGMWAGEGEFVVFFIAISEYVKMANSQLAHTVHRGGAATAAEL